jgi:hypothetical protein
VLPCLNIYNLQIAMGKYLPCIIFRALELNWLLSQKWEDQQERLLKLLPY